MVEHALALAAPLTSAMVAAAGHLYARLEQWVATDRALAALAERFPGFDLDAALLKVVTLNALYGTQVYAVFRMAQHMHRTLADGVPALAPAELVERLAQPPAAASGAKARMHLSFASKFAHFFIDAARYPILDSYAERMVALHLGRTNRTTGGTRYARFLADLDRLRAVASLDGSPRDLDRFLWLAGQYAAWRRNPRAAINTELQRLFTAPPAEAAAELATLVSGVAAEPGETIREETQEWRR